MVYKKISFHHDIHKKIKGLFEKKKKNPFSINLLIFDTGKKMPAALKKIRKFEK
jgi:hypothetical protein